MHSDNPLMHCRVCGLLQTVAPWGADGKTASFGFCPCCGVQFGYEDMTVQAVREYRDAWLSQGSPWFEPNAKPPEWDRLEQTKQIPETFK